MHPQCPSGTAPPFPSTPSCSPAPAVSDPGPPQVRTYLEDAVTVCGTRSHSVVWRLGRVCPSTVDRLAGGVPPLHSRDPRPPHRRVRGPRSSGVSASTVPARCWSRRSPGGPAILPQPANRLVPAREGHAQPVALSLCVAPPAAQRPDLSHQRVHQRVPRPDYGRTQPREVIGAGDHPRGLPRDVPHVECAHATCSRCFAFAKAMSRDFTQRCAAGRIVGAGRNGMPHRGHAP